MALLNKENAEFLDRLEKAYMRNENIRISMERVKAQEEVLDLIADVINDWSTSDLELLKKSFEFMQRNKD